MCCRGAALIMLIAAVLPRRIRSDWQPGRPLVFFADVARTGGGEPPRRAPEHRDPMPSLLAALTGLATVVVP
ncbi:Pycsar system effector family protein [Actinacidiphila glaucinigra]|uniref:Pycsar system effector family protein n=1 Tax=Actinacidiphila glaucinigra TaxID=235986 RepID=UPI00366C6934